MERASRTGPRPLPTATKAAGTLLLAVAGGVALWAATRSSPAPRRHPPLLQIEQGGLLYVFHSSTGMEALYDLRADPGCLRNLADERPADALRLRHALEREIGVSDLSGVSDQYEREREVLRRLGYL